MKKYFFALIIICGFTFSGYTYAQYIFGPDEYLIYATAIDTWYTDNPEKGVFIKDHTVLYTSLDIVEKELSYVRSRMPTLALETINDFKAKNLKKYPLDRFINQRSDYQIIKDTELINLFEHDEGWGRFYSRYPNADGVLALSRVGLNNDKTQALLCVANHWNRYAGVGLYVLLKKQDDSSWEIDENLRVWNSWILDRDEH